MMSDDPQDQQQRAAAKSAASSIQKEAGIRELGISISNFDVPTSGRSHLQSIKYFLNSYLINIWLNYVLRCGGKLVDPVAGFHDEICGSEARPGSATAVTQLLLQGPSAIALFCLALSLLVTMPAGEQIRGGLITVAQPTSALPQQQAIISSI